jgi:hypothetical protein
MAEKVINSLTINTGNISAGGENRRFSVNGEDGAMFIMQVVNSDGNFYNFINEAFSGGVGSGISTFSTENVLRVTMSSATYFNSIRFPSDSTVYSIILMPDSGNETRLRGVKQVFNKSLRQISNSTLTLAVATANTNSYSTDPAATSIESTGSSALVSSTSVAANYTVTNKSNDANGFGLRLTSLPNGKDYYFETTETVNGTVTAGIDIVVNDLTDLAVGMLVTGVSLGSLSGTPSILSIDTANKTLTLSSVQTFADGITLTFQARGFSAINSVLGCDIELSSVSAGVSKPGVSTTVRGAVSGSTTITVNGTYGIAGGSFVTFTGSNVNNVTTNNVNVVTASETAGSFTCDVAQTLKDKTVLTFTGSSLTVNITSIIIVNRYPAANRTINLNLDNFITPGVSGA